MRCIFCKNKSDNSISVEHIIPESLGNKEHILARGIVCDTCNQYFARKVEKIMLEYPYFEYTRHINDIENKKGRIPVIKGIIGGPVEISKDSFGNVIINIDNPDIVHKIQSRQINHMLIAHFDEPQKNDKIISRFIGKVAIETLAYLFYPSEGWNEEIVDKKELDFLRRYVSNGDKPEFWEYNQRRIYNESDRFHHLDRSDEVYEILHEFQFQYSEEGELFFVMVIMGVEYVISMTNPKINGYEKLLIVNAQASPIERKGERKIIKNNRYNQ